MAYVEWGQPLTGLGAEALPNAPLRDLLRACQAHPDIDVVELRHAQDGTEWHAIVVDAGDGTVAPRNAAGIHPHERLALVHRPSADMPFEVRALREDFPETLHQNAVLAGEPRSLCLYDQPWSALERSWTPAKFLTRLLQWLEKTADGSLHADDQALEQLFFDSRIHVVLPVGFSRRLQDESSYLRLHRAHEAPQRVTLLASFQADSSAPSLNRAIQPLFCELPATNHPPIQSPPYSLGDLEACIAQAGASLFPALSDAVRATAASGLEPPAINERVKTLLLLQIPRLRNDRIERIDVVGFILNTDIARLGLALGVLHQPIPQGSAFPFQNLAASDGHPSAESPDAWKSLNLIPMHIRHRVDREAARRWSGLSEEYGEFRGVLAGVGALGSALATLWAREGWGRWTLVDPDVVESHNVIRHQAYDCHVGLPKVEAVQGLMRSALGEHCAETLAIQAKANGDSEALTDAIRDANVLVDATTTLDVPRDWSMRDLPRTASVFLTPSGLGAVLLLENEARSIRVAALEAQYYRSILHQDWGDEHLRHTHPVQVGHGCRDRSVILSAGQVTLHAALLDQGLRRALASPLAAIHLWIMDERTGAVSFHDTLVHAVKHLTRGAWTVYWDANLEADLHTMRAAALPDETGGILLGVVDHKVHTIHLVEACPAPRNSSASPNSFIRGTVGVEDTRQRCLIRTGGIVDYVGEWHSHPHVASACPSVTDVTLLARLSEALAADGVPALMVIAGHEGDLSISLGEAT